LDTALSQPVLIYIVTGSQKLCVSTESLNWETSLYIDNWHIQSSKLIIIIYHSTMRLAISLEFEFHLRQTRKLQPLPGAPCLNILIIYRNPGIPPRVGLGRPSQCPQRPSKAEGASYLGCRGQVSATRRCWTSTRLIWVDALSPRYLMVYSTTHLISSFTEGRD
jgi:hypothetical protein